MRIAVLSDTHIPTRMSALPGKVYEVCSEADLVFHSGDFVDSDVVRDLERFAPLHAVQGNMDSLSLAYLPEKISVELEGHRICMTHGWGAPMGLANRVRHSFSDEKPDVIIFGHSHVFHHSVVNGITMLNPGSTSGRSGQRTMALLFIEEGSEPMVEKIEF